MAAKSKAANNNYALAEDADSSGAFRPNERVVYPAHGVGKILRFETQRLGDDDIPLLVIYFEKEKMTLRVPRARAAKSGLRNLSSPDEIGRAIDTLKGRARIKRMMWSRRAQEYEQKINSGNLISIAEVVRGPAPRGRPGAVVFRAPAL